MWQKQGKNRMLNKVVCTMKEINKWELVSWYFEPSQPQRITSGLNKWERERKGERAHQSQIYKEDFLFPLFPWRESSGLKALCIDSKYEGKWNKELQVMRIHTMHDDENLNRAVAGFSWIWSNSWKDVF